MATEAQIEANRRNAQRSTGPRTEEGKSRSRFNGLKHGLTAKELTFEEDFSPEAIAHKELWEASYDIRTPHELFLLEQCISCSWKLRRLNRVENDRWSVAAADRENFKSGSFNFGLGAPDDRTLVAYNREELALQRAVIRCERELRTSIKARQVTFAQKAKVLLEEELKHLGEQGIASGSREYEEIATKLINLALSGDQFARHTGSKPLGFTYNPERGTWTRTDGVEMTWDQISGEAHSQPSAPAPQQLDLKNLAQAETEKTEPNSEPNSEADRTQFEEQIDSEDVLNRLRNNLRNRTQFYERDTPESDGAPVVRQRLNGHIPRNGKIT